MVREINTRPEVWETEARRRELVEVAPAIKPEVYGSGINVTLNRQLQEVVGDHDPADPGGPHVGITLNSKPHEPISQGWIDVGDSTTEMPLSAHNSGPIEQGQSSMKASSAETALDVRLHEVIDEGSLSEIQNLLQQGANSNTMSSQGTLPLCVQAQRGNLAAVKVLLDHKADVNLADSKGRTTISYAAERTNTEMARLLMAVPGIDVNLKDEDLRAPLWVRIEDVDGEGRGLLHLAATAGAADLVEFLCGRDDVDVNRPDGRRKTAVAYALERKDDRALGVLLKYGAGITLAQGKGFVTVSPKRRRRWVEARLVEMSFGFSLGDFITVIDKAKKYQERFAAAPAEFRSLTQDFKSLVFVLEGINREREQYEDDAKQHLSDLVEGSSKILDDLGDMLEKTSSIETANRPGKRAKLDPSVAFSRFRLDPAQVQTLRSRILLKVQLLEVIRNSRDSQTIHATQQIAASVRDEQVIQKQQEILDWITPVDFSAQQEDYFSRRQRARLYSRLFVVVDALDECDSSSLKTLLQEVFRLQKHQSANIFVTSRPVPDIIQLPEFDLGVALAIRATDNDLRRYVEGRIPDMQEFVKKRRDLQEEIKNGVIRIARGMFLLAQLFLDSLSVKINVTALRKAINQVPNGNAAYSSIYDEALGRIRAQPPDRRELAIRVLGWITCAKRPLTAVELQHALAVAEDRKEIEEDDLTSFDTILSVCAGLVTRDEETGIIRLVHQTTQEYFDERRSRLFAEMDSEIATTSVFYLSSKNVLQVSEDARWPGRREDYRIACVPYYDYALVHWGAHACDSSTVPNGVVEFLRDHRMLKKAFEVMNQMGFMQFETAAQLGAWFGLRKVFDTGAILIHEAYSPYDHEKTAIWVAARQGHADLVTFFLDSGTLETSTHPLGLALQAELPRTACSHTLSVPLVRSTLRMAVGAGHVGVVETVVNFCAKKTITFELEGTFGTSIIEGAIKGEQRAIVNILLQHNSHSDSASTMEGHPGSVMGLGSSESCSPASILSAYTIRAGWLAAMECLFTSWYCESYDDWASAAFSLLLRAHHARGMIPLNPLDHANEMKWLVASKPYPYEMKSREDEINRLAEGWNPLVGTISNGLTKTLEVLLRNGFQKEIRDNYGRTPLSRATVTGKVAALRLLLKHGADIETKDANERTPLLLATLAENESVIKVILHHGADIGTRDSQGMTPVLLAARRGNVHLVQLLIGHGTDIEARDLNGRTALSWAASSGNEPTLQLLIKHKGQIESVDNLGRTPLFWATHDGNKRNAEALIVHGADVCARDQRGYTPFWGGTQSAFSLRQIRPLLGEDASGHNVNHRDNSKSTAMLFQVALRGSADELKSLLEMTDLNPGAIDIHGQTPPWYAMHSELGLENRQEIIELFLADPRFGAWCLDGQELLMTAIRANFTSYVRCISSRENVDVNKEFKGITPLNFAADLGYLAIFKIILECGATWGKAESDNVEVLSKSRWRFRDELLVWHYFPGQLL
ncbi:pfs domain-containing protein [Colletotrichum orchidophilum]|uniref:Pfs domain-containing protein n=1 Tax=Colletotrichum orchidophilum TaxID=1209926 RepID=A0A1G4B4T4_9PEZI|nr:pfs domain-containing protein [Colletotrichum orchidophilum]OHE96458.1 pfs domain-containing protein [Colletotrichum orchidophilum]